MAESEQPLVEPLSESSGAKHEAVGPDERQEASAETGAVEVEEVLILPVLLEIDRVREFKFAGLG